LTIKISLDEPFNGVDIQSNMIIEKIILELKKLGKTVLISSHILKTLGAICDEIFYLKEGEIEYHLQKDDFAILEDLVNGESINQKIANLEL